METTGIFLYRFPMFPLSLQGRLGRPTPGAEHDDQGLTPKKWSTEFEEENAADIVDIEKGHLLGGHMLIVDQVTRIRTAKRRMGTYRIL